MNHLALTTLGELSVTRNGEAVTGFDSNKVRALLVYLVVESHRAHTRDELATLLWPHFDNRTARNNLRYALYNLRKSIGDSIEQLPFLLINSQTLALNSEASVSIDTHIFERAIQSKTIDDVKQAITLYRGSFLSGFSIPDSAAFEDWLIHHRERYRRLLQSGLQYLSNTYERHGTLDSALHYARLQIDLEPWNEAAHQQAIRLLASIDQWSAALAQYEMCCQALYDELGVKPSAETIALYEEIRDGTFTKPSPVPSFLTNVESQIPSEAETFVGREDELAQLSSHLKDALESIGKLAFVVGEAGSGKTSLVQAFTQNALETFPELLVINGNCEARFGISDPYIPFVSILQMLSGSVEGQYLSGSISRSHAQRLWDVMPQFVDALISKGSDLIDRFVSGKSLLQRVHIGAPRQTDMLKAALARPVAATTNLQQLDLFDQYTSVLQEIASTTPLILIIDDLHWADPGSMSLLFHLGRRLRGYRILVIGLYRPHEFVTASDSTNEPLSGLINEFVQQGTPVIDLDRADGHGFINALIDTEPNRLPTSFRDQLYQHTMGHALFASELLNRLRRDGTLSRDASGCWYATSPVRWEILPPRVNAVIAERIERLPQDLYALLRMASVAGDYFTAQVVANALDRPSLSVVEQLSGPLTRDYQLVIAQSAQRHNGQLLANYRFRHVLFQTYLYSQIDLATRAYLHSDLADAIETLYGADKPELAAQLAYHFEYAQRIQRAIDYRRLAGDHAVQLLANDEAIRHYRHALNLLDTLPDSDQRLEQALDLRIALGVPLMTSRGFGSEELAENYNLARQLGHRVTNPIAHYRALVGLKSYYDLRLELTTAADLARECLRLAQVIEDDRLIMLSTHHVAVTQMYRGDYTEFMANRRQAHAMHDLEIHHDMFVQVGFDSEVAGLAHESWVLWYTGFADQARQRAQEAIALADVREHPFMRAMAYYFAATLYALLQDRPKTAILSKTASELSSEVGMPFWGIAADIAYIWARDDLSKVSVDDVRQMNNIMYEMGSELVRLGTTPQMAQICARLGELDYGLEILDSGIKQVDQTGFLLPAAEYYIAIGDLLVMKGELDVAKNIFQEALSVVNRTGTHSWGLRAGTKLANLWHLEGRLKKAHALLKAVMVPITEGYETRDWREAQALLDSIEQAESAT